VTAPVVTVATDLDAGTGRRLRPVATGVAVAVGAGTVGWIVSSWADASVSTAMLPWVLGRGLGIAAYLALAALTATGLWLRHPLRARVGGPSPSTLLWTHAALAAATLLLLTGHLVALAVDPFADVGWRGTLVPGLSHYRPYAVGLGVTGVYLGMIAAGSVVLAGRLVGRRWLPIHRLSSVAFGLVWLHAVLAGSDTSRLRWLYVGSGVALGLLLLTRRLLPTAAAMSESAVAE